MKLQTLSTTIMNKPIDKKWKVLIMLNQFKKTLTIALVICLISTSAHAMNASKIAILEAAEKGMLKTVEELIKKDKDCVDATDTEGNTALIFAAHQGHLECTQALIAAGAKIDLANEQGTTALEMAAQMDHPEIIKLLLQKGADTAHIFRFAIKNNNSNAIENLIKSGIDANTPINWRNETALSSRAKR